ncbi:MAG: ribose 5-phosphate isomerase B [Acidobacteria bacterium]|nr:ribose 5-phosphate isomerase B [Acidobacteriota bacterium]MCA1639981.1 ribose 5-phosphate isomerase B [Acidobacteriota bacterium]
MAENKETRERVRALVKEVLANVPLEEEQKPAENLPKRVVVNSLKEEIGKEFDRDESAKSLITEDDLRGLDSGARLRVADNAKFTPLASDIVQEKAINLIKKSSRRSTTKVKTVAVGADHGGFQFKEQLKDFLSELGLQIRDFGTNSEDAVDYPDFAHAVAKAVSEKQVDVGIIVDGAGIGSAITANKLPNVRAAACYNPALAKNSRQHNGANVLTLGSGQNTFAEIKEIVEVWLAADLTEERHKKRVAKIEAIERQYKS